MKMILFVCAVCLLSAGTFAQSTPAARVEQARTQKELIALVDAKVLEEDRARATSLSHFQHIVVLFAGEWVADSPSALITRLANSL